MGPLHGKVSVHMSSKSVGIARSRLRSGSGESRQWEYSLLLANGERTSFFPDREFRKAQREQAVAYLTQRTLAKSRGRKPIHANRRAPLCPPTA